MSKQDQFKYRQVSEFRSGKLTRRDAAKLLRMSERNVSRLASRIGKDGFAGVVHCNRGRKPANLTMLTLKRKVMRLVTSRYYDFNMLHCLEVLRSRHKIVIGRETFRKWCHEKQLVKRKKRRRTRPRTYRNRMPSAGYLLQMDGSPHRYNGRDVWSLIIAIDDATSEIPYGEFFLAETTSGCMKVFGEIIRRKGIPRALYVDKAGWAGGGKRVEFTQFHRACEELGVQIIYANSPEAKGRVERAFNTIQDRIIPELRVRRIKSMSEANRYLNQTFLKKYWNKKNTVEAQNPGTEYRMLKDISLLEEILCFKRQRAVDPGQCISIDGDIYQLRHPGNISLKRKRVQVRYYDDRPFSIYLESTKLEHRLVRKYRRPELSWEEKIDKLEKRLGLRKTAVHGTKSLGN